MGSQRPGVTNLVHIGLVVEDLDETVRFLTLLKLRLRRARSIWGEWIDRIIGLENVTVETVMDRAPDGSDMFEVVRFVDYESTFLLCYVRGPEGLIVELAERLDAATG